MALYNITTKEEFAEKVISNHKVVLVDFWANWCAPCRAMAPALHDIAEAHDDLIDVVKVDIEDTDDNRALAEEYGVRSIPNMPLFLNGKEVERIVGLVSESDIVNLAKDIQKKTANS